MGPVAAVAQHPPPPPIDLVPSRKLLLYFCLWGSPRKIGDSTSLASQPAPPLAATAAAAAVAAAATAAAVAAAATAAATAAAAAV